MTQTDQGALPYPVVAASGTVARWTQPQIPLLVLGIAAWMFGLSQLHLPHSGSYGLLAGANPWFLLGLAAPLVSLVLELRSGRRPWLLGAQLLALIVAIHATVPLLYGAPEYAWVYKHIGIACCVPALRARDRSFEHLSGVAGAVRRGRGDRVARPRRDRVAGAVGAAGVRDRRRTLVTCDLPAP